MDALSQLLEAVRLCAGAFLQAEFTEPWSIRAQVGPEDCPLPGQIPACLMPTTTCSTVACGSAWTASRRWR